MRDSQITGQAPSLDDLGWHLDFDSQITARERDDAAVTPARVVAVHRTLVQLIGPFDGSGELDAELAPTLARADDPRDRPTVGDWVLARVDPDGVDEPRVARLLRRRGALTRIRAGGTGAAQLIAANVDLVLVATSLNADLNPRRIERYLAAIHGSGAEPLVLLTKADLVDDAALTEARARAARVARQAEVLDVCALEGRGLDAVRSRIGRGTTACVVGSSGVGKSTLVNALLGEQVQATLAIREDDAKGRHATTHRELFGLPGGGWLIDTPGMRELGLWVEGAAPGEGLDAAFDEVATLARQCQFRDCRHDGEPGCAVGEAIDAGELDAERLRSYRKLGREVARMERRAMAETREGKAARREERARQRALHKKYRSAAKARLRRDGHR